MPNFAMSLKAEISRIARKVLKVSIESFAKNSVQHRRDIAALKKKIAALERALKSRNLDMTSHASNSLKSEEEDSGSPNRRFSAPHLAKMRNKLGLSAGDFGKLIGAFGQSVYKWESGDVHSRASQLEGIAKARTLGKRQIEELLGRS